MQRRGSETESPAGRTRDKRSLPLGASSAKSAGRGEEASARAKRILDRALEVARREKEGTNWVWLKLNSWDAGFRLWFHLPRCHFGTYLFEPQPIQACEMAKSVTGSALTRNPLAHTEALDTKATSEIFGRADTRGKVPWKRGPPRELRDKAG